MSRNLGIFSVEFCAHSTPSIWQRNQCFAMPPRLARSSLSAAAPKNVRNKSQKRRLNAYAIAGKTAPEKTKIRQHRLGETLDDQPRQKRRRVEDGDEDPENDEDGDDNRETLRRKAGVDDDDDDVGYGSDSEGNEWKTGGVADDDDDESLDSDEAFGESDEERFEGFTFRGSSSGRKSKRVKPKAPKAPTENENMDLGEDDNESEEEEGFGDEGVDLATMLDGSDGEMADGNNKASKVRSEEDFGDDDRGEEEEDNTDSGEDIEGFSDDEEDDNEERHARLQDFVEALDGGAESRTRASRLGVADNDPGTLTLEDLLEDAGLDKKTLATLKPKRKVKAPEVVTAPLPKRQQDRIDREIATKKAKEQLDRWRDTVVHNRRAEFLSFPLRNPDQGEPQGKDMFMPSQQSGPKTELEANIRRIMEESGISAAPNGRTGVEDNEQDLLKAEELATNKMPIEEVVRRRAELRRARELLFREEVRAKRIAKIKSKAYRRVHRKERERLADKERMLLDPEGLGSGMLTGDEKELADRRRAEARMGAKHKDSKWARSLKATDRAVWDQSAREGVVEQARRQEELKRRMAGKDLQDDESDAFTDDDNDEDEDENEGNGHVISRGLQALANTEGKDQEKGLAGMKFMRAAAARQTAANNDAVAQLRREFGDEEDVGVGEDEEQGLGRAIFGPRPTVSKPVPKIKGRELEEGDVTEDEGEETHDNATRSSSLRNSINEPAAQPRGILKNSTRTSEPLKTGLAYDRRAPQSEQAKDQSQGLSSWLTGPREKQSKLDKKLSRNDDSDGYIDTHIGKDNFAPAGASEGPQEKKQDVTANASSAGDINGWTTVRHGPSPEHADTDSDAEPEAAMLSQTERNAAFHARAFAGDDVGLQFAAEKSADVASEDERENSTHMPGWGSWAGNGLTKAAKKAAVRARHNPLYKTKVPGTRPRDRKDAKLENVIISEKNDRKGRKYLAPMLPHQFERKDEYERSLRMPLGPEWATKEVFQRNTRPRVVVKPGSVIEAIERPIV